MERNEVVVNIKGKESVSDATAQAQGSLKRLGDATRKIGMGMTAVGAGITASFGLAIKSFATAEQ